MSGQRFIPQGQTGHTGTLCCAATADGWQGGKVSQSVLTVPEDRKGMAPESDAGASADARRCAALSHRRWGRYAAAETGHVLVAGAACILRDEGVGYATSCGGSWPRRTAVNGWTRCARRSAACCPPVGQARRMRRREEKDGHEPPGSTSEAVLYGPATPAKPDRVGTAAARGNSLKPAGPARWAAIGTSLQGALSRATSMIRRAAK